MAEDLVQLPRDGAGKKVRTTSTEIDSETVHQQVVQIADSENNIIDPTTETDSLRTLNQILKELRKMNMHLSKISGERIKYSDIEVE